MKLVAENEQSKIARFEKGEELISAITDFCKEEGIQGAFFYGIGGATEVTLQYYSLSDGKYHQRTYSGDLEIAPLSGNVAEKDDELIIHAHATVGIDNDLKAVAGHVKKLTVAGTCEVCFTLNLKGLKRSRDPETGLDLLQPKG